MSYIDLPLEPTDWDTMVAEALDYLVANVPGYVPREGHVEVWLIEAILRHVAESKQLTVLVAAEIFSYFGQSLLELPTIEAAPATATSTWTAIDSEGYTVPAGTLVAKRTAGDTLIAFTVDADVVIAPGSATTGAGAVALTAVTDGTEANGLSGDLELIDSLAFVDTVTLAADTSGGVEAETAADYRDRLVEELRLSSPRPILPADFSVLAKRVAGVARAVTLDGYNPNDATTNNERMVTVALVDEDGANVSAGVKTAVDDYLEGLREVTFVVWVMDPIRTVVNISFTVKAKADADANAVEADTEAAVAAYIDPANWGGGDEDPPTWRNETTVRYLEVASVINAVDGVDYITALTINGVAANLALGGVISLPTVGAIVATVT